MEIIHHSLDHIENSFIKLINEEVYKYPFKFYRFMTLIFTKPNIYIKDTTLIYERKSLDSDSVKILDYYFSLFRTVKAVRKVISKKDYQVLYLYSSFITSFLKEKNKYFTIPLYFRYKDQIELYFDAIINDKTYYMALCINDSIYTLDNRIYKGSEVTNNVIPLSYNDYSSTNHKITFKYELSNVFTNDSVVSISNNLRLNEELHSLFY